MITWLKGRRPPFNVKGKLREMEGGKSFAEIQLEPKLQFVVSTFVAYLLPPHTLKQHPRNRKQLVSGCKVFKSFVDDLAQNI